MKASRSKEIDYLLINLSEHPQKANWNEAVKYRIKNSTRDYEWTYFGTK
jgi:hypothetical protein